MKTRTNKRNKLKKGMAGALVAATLGMGAMTATAPPADAAINVGALMNCLLHPEGEVVQDTEDGSIWCSYWDGVIIDQIA